MKAFKYTLIQLQKTGLKKRQTQDYTNSVFSTLLFVFYRKKINICIYICVYFLFLVTLPNMVVRTFCTQRQNFAVLQVHKRQTKEFSVMKAIRWQQNVHQLQPGRNFARVLLIVSVVTLLPNTLLPTFQETLRDGNDNLMRRRRFTLLVRKAAAKVP